jgi:hypothetical protein
MDIFLIPGLPCLQVADFVVREVIQSPLVVAGPMGGEEGMGLGRIDLGGGEVGFVGIMMKEVAGEVDSVNVTETMGKRVGSLDLEVFVAEAEAEGLVGVVERMKDQGFVVGAEEGGLVGVVETPMEMEMRKDRGFVAGVGGEVLVVVTTEMGMMVILEVGSEGVAGVEVTVEKMVAEERRMEVSTSAWMHM